MKGWLVGKQGRMWKLGAYVSSFEEASQGKKRTKGHVCCTVTSWEPFQVGGGGGVAGVSHQDLKWMPGMEKAGMGARGSHRATEQGLQELLLVVPQLFWSP